MVPFVVFLISVRVGGHTALSLSLTDIVPTIITIIDSTVLPLSTATVTGSPVTVTVTADPSVQTLTPTTQTQTSTLISRSGSSAAASTSVLASTSTDPPEFVTTTYLTSSGTSVITTTALVSDQSARTQNLSSTDFFSNHAAVVGVFTGIGILCFAAIVAIIAWVARRRTLKRWQREKAEKASFDQRNILHDEMHDEFSRSEKSLWTGASGTSIPDGTGVPLRVVTAPSYNPPPVPALPADLSPTAMTWAGAGASQSLVANAETVGPISHPYGSPNYSMAPDLYQVGSPMQHQTITSITATREVARSPPPSIPLPPLPHSNGGQDSLPMILEGPPSAASTPPSATSTVGWASQIQPVPGPSNEVPPLPLSVRVDTSMPFSSPSKVAGHPYASPPINRKSELYPDDVLLDLGDIGGVGRSLSGSRPARVSPAANAFPLSENTSGGGRIRTDFESRAQTSNGHSDSLASYVLFREGSKPGVPDGGWDDGSARAAASGESVLGGHEARNSGFEYAENRDGHILLANGLSVDLAERRRVPHDPRLSGLFGSWSDTLQDQLFQRDSTASANIGTEDDHYGSSPQAPRVLRVTNE